jgi:terminase large subunit-like protein
VLKSADPRPLYLTKRTKGAPVHMASELDATANLIGRPLWAWQRRIINVACELRPDGRFRYPVVVVSVPRQSGKTTLIATLCLARCLNIPDCQVWYTAQTRMDAVLRYREMVRLLRASSLVEARIGGFGIIHGDYDFRIRGSTGNEAIEFSNGSAVRLFAPSEDSLHGSVTDLVGIDEARFFTERQGAALMAAALPTQATRNGQVWITSTAGGPESTFLAAQMELGLASLTEDGSRLAYAEYGIADDVPDDALLDAVIAAHPSAGLPGGPVTDALAVAFAQMPRWQFAHEFGNRWRTGSRQSAIPVEVWDEQAAASLPTDQAVLTFGADVALNRESAVIVACSGNVLEVVDQRPGAGWLPGRLRELVERWEPTRVAIHGGGPAGTVAELLRPSMPVLTATTERQLAAACGLFYDAVVDRSLFHVPDPVLDGSVRQAVKRTHGQTWVWSRVQSGPAIVAASLAYWACVQPAAEDVEASAIW